MLLDLIVLFLLSRYWPEEGLVVPLVVVYLLYLVFIMTKGLYRPFLIRV